VPPGFSSHPRVREIALFENEATDHEQAGRLTEALECWEAAVESRRCFLSDAHEETGLSIECFILRCNLWSLQSMSADAVPLALEFLKKADAMFEATGSVSSFKQRHALRAQTLQLVASYFRLRGKTQAALQSSSKAARLAPKLQGLDRVTMLSNHAALLSAGGRHKEALLHLEQAVAILIEGQDTRRDSSSDERTPPASDAQSRLRKEQEVSHLLVVTRHNMWIEYCYLGMRNEGGWAIQRAAQTAMLRLGDAHPLTVKVEAAVDWHLGTSLPPPKAEASGSRRTSSNIEEEQENDDADDAAGLVERQPCDEEQEDATASEPRTSRRRPSSAVGDGQGFEESERAMQLLAERNVITRRIVPNKLHFQPPPQKPSTPRTSGQRTPRGGDMSTADGEDGWVPNKLQERVYGLRPHPLPSWALTPRQAADPETLVRPWVTPRRGPNRRKELANGPIEEGSVSLPQ